MYIRAHTRRVRFGMRGVQAYIAASVDPSVADEDPDRLVTRLIAGKIPLPRSVYEVLASSHIEWSPPELVLSDPAAARTPELADTAFKAAIHTLLSDYEHIDGSKISFAPESGRFKYSRRLANPTDLRRKADAKAIRYIQLSPDVAEHAVVEVSSTESIVVSLRSFHVPLFTEFTDEQYNEFVVNHYSAPTDEQLTLDDSMVTDEELASTVLSPFSQRNLPRAAVSLQPIPFQIP